eukprot:gene5892-9720_t
MKFLFLLLIFSLIFVLNSSPKYGRSEIYLTDNVDEVVVDVYLIPPEAVFEIQQQELMKVSTIKTLCEEFQTKTSKFPILLFIDENGSRKVLNENYYTDVCTLKLDNKPKLMQLLGVLFDMVMMDEDENLTFKITDFSMENKKTIAFDIQIHQGERKWKIKRNYKQLEKLIQELKKNFEVKQTFPKDLSKMEKTKIQEKMKEIDDYFEEMIKSKPIKNSQTLNHFLSLNYESTTTKSKGSRFSLFSSNVESFTAPPSFRSRSSSTRKRASSLTEDEIEFDSEKIKEKMKEEKKNKSDGQLKKMQQEQQEDEEKDDLIEEKNKIIAETIDIPNYEKFSLIYEKSSGKEFLKLYTNYSNVYYSNEEIIGVVEFHNENESFPKIKIQCIKEINATKDPNQYISTTKYINHLITCKESPCWFKIKIPKKVTFGNYEFESDTSNSFSVKINYKININMLTKKNIKNLYGLIGFSTKNPITIYPKPLLELSKKKENTMIEARCEEEKFKNNQLKIKLHNKILFCGDKGKIAIYWKNNQKENSIHSFNIFLIPQILIKFRAKESKGNSNNQFDSIMKSPRIEGINQKLSLKKIHLGSLDVLNSSFQLQSKSFAFEVPSNIFPNEDFHEDFSVNYKLIITASTSTEQNEKDPKIEIPVMISSPLPKNFEERFSNIQNESTSNFGF